MNESQIVSRFINYVKIDSLSGKEGNFAKVLKKDMEDLGLEVIVDNANIPANSDTGNLIGYLKGDDSLPTIMLCAHMDTVVPGININPIIDEEIIRTDGSTILGADDKSGIVAILEAIKYVKENNIPHGNIEVVFTVCEESGMHGSKNLDYSKIQSKMAFILDSSGDVGGVIVQGPAQTQIQANFIGKSAHAGLNPEKGISAIQVAARAIDNMKLLRIDEETTANVGIISGGTATNIVTDRVEVKLECRSLSNEKLNAQTEHMVSVMEQAAKDFATTVEIDVKPSYPEFSVSLDEPILKLIEKAITEIGLNYDPRTTGGGSDTNIFNNRGIKAVTLATGMTNAHSTEEFIKIEDLVKSTELVVSIMKNI